MVSVGLCERHRIGRGRGTDLTTPLDHHARSKTLLAISAILLAVLALSFGDALIKLSSVTFSIWQMFVLRSVIALVLVLGLLAWRVPHLSRVPLAPFWAIARSLLLSVMWVAYYAALPFMPLSVAAAAYYTIPLFITLFAAVFVGEHVGGKRWFAILLGFVGMLVMLKPDAAGFNAYALLPVFAAILYALAMILTRTKCQEESPLVLSLVLNLTFIAVGGMMTGLLYISPPSSAWLETYPFLLAQWSHMSPLAWGIVAALAVIIVVGSIASAYAYQNGPSSVIATFDYGYLAFAVLWGVVFFAEIPDGLSLVGMIMITLAGIIAARR